MNDVRVATVQFEHADGDKRANLGKIRGFVAAGAKREVRIMALPECCITGYTFLRGLGREEIEALAEPVFEGPSSQELMSLSREYGMTIGAGLIEAGEDGEFYNTYVVAMPDGVFARHRKLHCFVSEHMSSGSDFTVFDTPQGARVGVLTCYDNNLGENVRVTALMGAEILLAPHQTGGCMTPSVHCMGLVNRMLWDRRELEPEAIEAEFAGPKGRAWLMTWLPARAHDNGLFVLYSNGVGVDGPEIRTGNAMVLDCYGRILGETCRACDDMVVADLDASLRDKCTGGRWIKTRRPELYGPLTVPTGREQDLREVRYEGGI